jgi:hypothetical protein
MKKIILFTAVATFILCCRQPGKFASVTATAPDSLLITVTSTNLSENMSGNDELLIICYPHHDSLALEEPLFRQKLRIDLKHLSREFKCKPGPNAANRPLLLFLIEQDADLPVPQIDSTLRVSHREIIKAYKSGTYTAIERYLGDEDILGAKVISNLNFSTATVIYFTGSYKLDKYEYQVTIEVAK